MTSDDQQTTKSCFKQREHSSAFLELHRARTDKKDLQWFENKLGVQRASQGTGIAGGKPVPVSARAPRDYNHHSAQRHDFYGSRVLRQPATVRGEVTWSLRVTCAGQVALRGGPTDCGADGGRGEAQVPPIRPPPSLLP